MCKRLIQTLGMSLAGLAIAIVVAAPAAGATPEPPAVPVGSVVWYDLLTEDAGAVMDFYREIFGWDYKEHKPGAWVVLHNGQPIAGISEIENSLPEVEESFWLAGISVKNVDAAVTRARTLGAKVHLGVDELPGFARYAVIEDPQSAALLLVTPLTAIGGAKGHGTWVWTELWTDDVDAAVEFYGEVIGYEPGEIDVNGKPYRVFELAGAARVGVLETPYENVDPTWAPYIGVGKFETVLRMARELGGRVILEPAPDLADGRVALLADPAGAAFFVYDLEKISEVSP